jgi:hypothetical protein
MGTSKCSPYRRLFRSCGVASYEGEKTKQQQDQALFSSLALFASFAREISES